MRLRQYLLAAALTLSGCAEQNGAANAATDAQSSGQRVAAPTRFDIAGVRVGDGVDAAAAMLRQRGWTVDIERRGWSFDDFVRREQARAAGRSYSPRMDGPQTLSARRNGEFVFARVRTSPSGGLIETISYTSPGAGRTRDQMIAEVQGRYGPARRRTARSSDWRICAPAEPVCGRNPSQYNHVIFETGTELEISIFPGVAERRQWQAEFDAALRARVGPVQSTY